MVIMPYAVGDVSGCHLTQLQRSGSRLGCFPSSQIAPNVIAQVVGPVIAAALLYLIASGAHGRSAPARDASSGAFVWA